MRPTPHLLAASISLGLAAPASAAFIDDSQAVLDARNFYFNRDFRQDGAAQSKGKTWERNTDIAYVVQSGPLQNLGLRLRNAGTRSNFGPDLDENRLILSYSLALW